MGVGGCGGVHRLVTPQNNTVVNLQDTMDLKGHPIVAWCNSPIKHLSKLTELILKPLVKTNIHLSSTIGIFYVNFHDNLTMIALYTNGTLLVYIHQYHTT